MELTIVDNIAPTLYWTEIEAAMAVVCACLPTLRPVFANVSPEALIKEFTSKISLFSSRSGSTSVTSRSEQRGWEFPGQGSTSSLRGGQNTCEAFSLTDLENGPIPAHYEIIVQKAVYQTSS